jgi:hypothetical protein
VCVVSWFTAFKVWGLLKAHCNSFFPNYSKLKAISAHIEWTGRVPSQSLSGDNQSSVAAYQSPQLPDSAMSAFPSGLVTSTSNLQPSFSTRPSSPPLVPQSATLCFVPCLQQYPPEPFRSAPLYTNSSSTPLASRQAVQHSVRNPGQDCPIPTSSFLALERGDPIQQFSGTPRLETQPESTTSPFSSPSHSPSTSASENPEAGDFIHRWIRTVGSDLDPNALSPRSSVDCRLEDETAISDDNYPDQIPDHINTVDDQGSEVLHVVKAMHALSGSSAFSYDEKASLLFYLL